VRRRAHPGRAAEARHRGQQAFRPAVPAPRTGSSPEPVLADVPPQPAGEHLGGRSPDRPDPHLPDVVRPGLRQPCPARAGAPERDRHPTAAWIWRQLVEATPWGGQPRYLVRDRDAAYGRDFAHRARRLGIATVLTPIRAPRANAVAARLVGTLRRECLDHLVILNEAHLRAALTEFLGYYDVERPHRTLALQTPTPAVRPTVGAIRSRPVLGGLHHAYQRSA
jgi:Integrase core domain